VDQAPPSPLRIAATPAAASFPLGVRVMGLDPGAQVELFHGDAGRGRCLPALPGVCLGIRRAVRWASGTADAAGVATFSGDLPPDASGVRHLQAVGLVAGAPTLTRVLEVHVAARGVDTDADGIDDAVEVGRWGTDPSDADSDGDGALDGVEVDRTMDPLDADQDADGIVDGLDLMPRQPGPFDAFVPVDDVVSDPLGSLPDPEFDSVTARVLWQEDDGSALWVASVDPATGVITPVDGRGVQVAANVAPMNASGNGPEWLKSDRGAETVYARDVGGDWALFRATETAPDQWTEALEPGTQGGVGPGGSLDEGDPRARVLYLHTPVGGPTALRARELGVPASDVAAPAMLLYPRWIPGTRAIIGARRVQGINQITRWDIDTMATETLTQDGVDHGSAFVFTAPELGGEPLFFTTHADRPDLPTSIVTWRRLRGTWQPYRQITMPPAFPYVISPEPFEWNGRAYVSFVASTEPRNVDNGLAMVYIASLVPVGGDLVRAVSGPASMVRKDPESFVGGGTPWVYYTEVEPTGRRIVHRCALGL
jgi:hypothetical protein